MGGLKKGTGSLDFDDDDTSTESSRGDNPDEKERSDESADKVVDSATEATAEQTDEREEHTGEGDVESQESVDAPSPEPADSSPMGDFDVDNLPYLVQRQVRGASVNADRTNQLLLEVRPFIKKDEDAFLTDLKELVDGPVYKGDAREAAMAVAHEHPELVAEKLREWGIEYLER